MNDSNLDNDCPILDGYCIANEASKLLSKQLFQTLMTFIWGAESGARISITRTEDNFELEITGGVTKPNSEEITADHLRLLMARLERLR